MDRRDFIKLGTTAASALFFNSALFADVKRDNEKILILLELKGGNDGLNTIVPTGSEYTIYRNVRPTLALDRTDILPLDAKSGMHPSLQSLYPLWKSKTMAIVQGVGYPDPNRSHFKSIAIYNTATSDNHTHRGWIDRIFEPIRPDEAIFARGIAMGNRELGPLYGKRVRAVTMDSPKRYLKQAQIVEAIEKRTSHPMLSHIIDIENEIATTSKALESRLHGHCSTLTGFPKTKLGRDFKHIAQLIACGVRTPVYKVTHDGFDTHVNQKEKHGRRLKEFADAVASFENTMKTIGRWNDVVVMTYSEFGRRVAENGGRGTDHGTASVQFVFGGSVRGGFYGREPSLERLDKNGDLIYTTDFRSLYKNVALHCFGKTPDFLASYPFLNIFS
ncbi:DUF1501 domain-containing protein [Hydrogenimonas cancrithermarum]|uniref:DUF1501 domain-containing protein n=1 Tax=Hydrogenimonas cancrithermarum TaxID=2993563 RepID=A0ABM8FIE3_9BACT|nr:DUF1501 domain-containing protein [Hydrogenimonas cancrithermarum]BDY12063.1 hypothetical protein HCR_03750 [Hydrogenimonas cancrithermarum]